VLARGTNNPLAVVVEEEPPTMNSERGENHV
jgi:hypothetical protein